MSNEVANIYMLAVIIINIMQENNSEKKSILNEITVALITAIIVSLINYFVWQKQNNISQEQKFYENKIASIEKFALSTSKFIYYNEFTTRIKLNQYKLEQKIGDSINSVNKYSQIDTIPYEYTNNIQKKLQRLYPLQYEMHMKCLEFQHEANTNIILPKFLFHNDISQKLDSLQDTFTEKNIRSKIDLIRTSKKIDFYSLNENALVAVINKEQVEILSRILSEMNKEIKLQK